MKRKILFALVALVLLSPLVVSAANLVPCGGPGEETCQLCYLVTLIKNVNTWLVTVLSVVITIIFVVAGVQLVSSTGNVARKESSKKMVINGFIGFVIVLMSWFFVNFILESLLGSGEIGSFGPWNSIQCVAQPIAYTVSSGLENGGILTANCTETSPGVYDCNSAVADCLAGEGEVQSVSTTTGMVECNYPASVYSGSCSEITDANNPCDASQANMISAFGSRVNEAEIICNKESGGAAVKSGSDICCGVSTGCTGANGVKCAACSGKPSFSGGYFQINVLSEAGSIPNCTPGAFYKKVGTSIQGSCVQRNSSGICTGWSCEITDTAMYNECMKVTTDSALNFSIAGKLFSTRGFQPWANSANACDIPYK